MDRILAKMQGWKKRILVESREYRKKNEHEHLFTLILLVREITDENAVREEWI